MDGSPGWENLTKLTKTKNQYPTYILLMGWYALTQWQGGRYRSHGKEMKNK